jgi:hypothetical protein
MKSKIRRLGKGSSEDYLINRISSLVAKEMQVKGVTLQGAFKRIIQNNPGILEGIEQMELEQLKLNLQKIVTAGKRGHYPKQIAPVIE